MLSFAPGCGRRSAEPSPSATGKSLAAESTSVTPKKAAAQPSAPLAAEAAADTASKTLIRDKYAARGSRRTAPTTKGASSGKSAVSTGLDTLAQEPADQAHTDATLPDPNAAPSNDLEALAEQAAIDLQKLEASGALTPSAANKPNGKSARTPAAAKAKQPTPESNVRTLVPDLKASDPKAAAKTDAKPTAQPTPVSAPVPAQAPAPAPTPPTVAPTDINTGLGTLGAPPTPAPTNEPVKISQDTNPSTEAAAAKLSTVAPRTDTSTVANVDANTLTSTVEVARRMATLLRDKNPDGSAKVSDSVALGSVEAMIPGILTTVESPGNPLGDRLTPPEIAALAAARDRSKAAQPSTIPTPVQPKALPSTSSTTAPAQPATPPAPSTVVIGAKTDNFTIPRAALCTRVQGFGKFEPYASETFVSGKPVRAIVYVEVDNFQTRPARAGDPVQMGSPLSEQLSVDLTQTLTLFQDTTGGVVWQKPAQTVVETTRGKRRDFYLIQTIELPRNLMVGRYNLKITLRDASSGTETEQVLPINIIPAGGIGASGR